MDAFTLDDFESRSGSATSILRTIAGLYLRHASSPVSRTRVLTLATSAGVGQAAAQTAITRLADRGLLQTPQDGMVSISSPALAMFARGTRRIFTPRQMSADDQWVLVTYSLPESMRPVRHQLRKHFSQLGGGQVSAGLWIFPEYLHAEVLEVLVSLEVRQNATLFVTGRPEFAHSAAAAAGSWWDLQKLGKRHEDFIATVAHLGIESGSPAHSYCCYVTLIDAWRAIPYLDPGLPESMLPKEWPGQRSRELFLALSAAHQQAAQDYADHLLGSESS